jgi:hypothetical protein
MGFAAGARVGQRARRQPAGGTPQYRFTFWLGLFADVLSVN